VYKDAFEYEFKKRSLQYEREKEFSILYKDIILPHTFRVHFVLFQEIILEVRSKDGIADEDFARMINYLRCSKLKIGLLLNFGKANLDIKRVVY
jgi:GxxExxY protein